MSCEMLDSFTDNLLKAVEDSSSSNILVTFMQNPGSSCQLTWRTVEVYQIFLSNWFSGKEDLDIFDMVLDSLIFLGWKNTNKLAWCHFESSISNLVTSLLNIIIQVEETIGYFVQKMLKFLVFVTKTTTEVWESNLANIINIFVTFSLSFNDMSKCLKICNTIADIIGEDRCKEIASSNIKPLLTYSKLILVVGDFNTQSDIVEFILRHVSLNKLLAEGFFTGKQETFELFMKLDFKRIEVDIRAFTNHINDTLGPDRKVFSVLCNQVMLGGLQLTAPSDENGIWLDLNIARGQLGINCANFQSDSLESDVHVLTYVPFTDILEVDSRFGTSANQDCYCFNIRVNDLINLFDVPTNELVFVVLLSNNTIESIETVLKLLKDITICPKDVFNTCFTKKKKDRYHETDVMKIEVKKPEYGSSDLKGCNFTLNKDSNKMVDQELYKNHEPEITKNIFQESDKDSNQEDSYEGLSPEVNEELYEDIKHSQSQVVNAVLPNKNFIQEPGLSKDMIPGWNVDFETAKTSVLKNDSNQLIESALDNYLSKSSKSGVSKDYTHTMITEWSRDCSIANSPGFKNNFSQLVEATINKDLNEVMKQPINAEVDLSGKLDGETRSEVDDLPSVIPNMNKHQDTILKQVEKPRAIEELNPQQVEIAKSPDQSPKQEETAITQKQDEIANNKQVEKAATPKQDKQLNSEQVKQPSSELAKVIVPGKLQEHEISSSTLNLWRNMTDDSECEQNVPTRCEAFSIDPLANRGSIKKQNIDQAKTSGHMEVENHLEALVNKTTFERKVEKQLPIVEKNNKESTDEMQSVPEGKTLKDKPKLRKNRSNMKLNMSTKKKLYSGNDYSQILLSGSADEKDHALPPKNICTNTKVTKKRSSANFTTEEPVAKKIKGLVQEIENKNLPEAVKQKNENTSKESEGSSLLNVNGYAYKKWCESKSSRNSFWGKKVEDLIQKTKKSGPDEQIYDFTESLKSQTPKYHRSLKRRTYPSTEDVKKHSCPSFRKIKKAVSRENVRTSLRVTKTKKEKSEKKSPTRVSHRLTKKLKTDESIYENWMEDELHETPKKVKSKRKTKLVGEIKTKLASESKTKIVSNSKKTKDVTNQKVDEAEEQDNNIQYLKEVRRILEGYQDEPISLVQLLEQFELHHKEALVNTSNNEVSASDKNVINKTNNEPVNVIESFNDKKNLIDNFQLNQEFNPVEIQFSLNKLAEEEIGKLNVTLFEEPVPLVKKREKHKTSHSKPKSRKEIPHLQQNPQSLKELTDTMVEYIQGKTNEVFKNSCKADILSMNATLNKIYKRIQECTFKSDQLSVLTHRLSKSYSYYLEKCKPEFNNLKTMKKITVSVIKENIDPSEDWAVLRNEFKHKFGQNIQKRYLQNLKEKFNAIVKL